MANIFPSPYESEGGCSNEIPLVIGTDQTFTADQAVAPDGNTTGDELTCSTTDTDFRSSTLNQSSGISADTLYYYSVFVKADGSGSFDWVAIYGGTSQYGIYVDLTDGSVGSFVTGEPNDYGVVDYGNGWYRIWIREFSSSGSVFALRFFICEQDASRTTSGIVGDVLYTWGWFLDTVNYTDWDQSPVPILTIHYTE